MSIPDVRALTSGVALFNQSYKCNIATFYHTYHVEHHLTVLQIEKLFDIACCLIDVVAYISFLPNEFALSPHDCVSRFLTFISTIRGGQSRYLPLLLVKLSEVLPNFRLSRSLDLPETIPASTLGLNATHSRTVSSNVADGFSVNPSNPATNFPLI